jgi:hypothetical protein
MWTSGLFALGGIALGWGLNAITESWRRRRDARTRWNDLRRDLAVRFLEATERVWEWSNKLTNMTKAEQTGMGLVYKGAETFEATMAKIGEADRDVRSLDTEIQLIGSDSEKESAHRLREAAWAVGAAYSAYQRAEEGEREARQREFDAANGDYVDARDAFLVSARKGLLAA